MQIVKISQNTSKYINLFNYFNYPKCAIILFFNFFSLCRSQWGYASIYSKQKSDCHFSYHHLYLQLDEGTVTFNADAFMVIILCIKYLKFAIFSLQFCFSSSTFDFLLLIQNKAA